MLKLCIEIYYDISLQYEINSRMFVQAARIYFKDCENALKLVQIMLELTLVHTDFDCTARIAFRFMELSIIVIIVGERWSTFGVHEIFGLVELMAVFLRLNLELLARLDRREVA